MIIDSLKNAHKYYSYSPGVKQALEFLQTVDLSKTEPGRYDIDGDNLYYLVLDRPCDPNYDAYFEGHRKYLDIHFVADGEEWFGYSDVSNMKEQEYNTEKDFSKYEGEGCFFLLKKNDFCLTDLQDLHSPSTYKPNSPFLKKVCVKIRL